MIGMPGDPASEPSGRKPGFTLIEVVVTLAIVGVLAVVAVPAFLGESRSSELDAAAERLESILSLARDSAVSSATTVRVVIDSASALVWLSDPRGAAAGPNAVSTSSALSMELSPSVRMISTAARSEFVFRPGGSAFPDSVLFTDATGARLVTLNPMTGHVVVLR